MQTDDVQADMRAAFESVTGGGGEASAEAPPIDAGTAGPIVSDTDAQATDAPASPEAAASGARDSKGRFAPKKAAADAPAATGKSSAKADKAADGTVAPPPGEPAATELPATGEQSVALRAPQSWTPAARETWAKLPPEAQKEINRREQEIARGMQESAPHRKHFESFSKTLEPYRAMLGTSDPMQAISGLLNTAYVLQTAPPHQKAQLLAHLVQSYGVPIDALDSALSGQTPAQGQGQPTDPNAIAQQVRQQVLAQIQQERSHVTHQRTAKEVQDFSAKSEFFDDVREDMADLVDGAARRGVEMSLADAYNRACRMNEQVWSIIQQREAAKAATAGNAATQRARTAASSVRTSPATQGSDDLSADSPHAAIASAFNRLNGR